MKACILFTKKLCTLREINTYKKRARGSEMKKVISIFLSLLMVLTMTVPVAAMIGEPTTANQATIAKAAKSIGLADLFIDSQVKYSEAFKVLTIVNQAREKAGASKLEMDTKLLEEAMLRAEETAIYFSHTRPNGTRWDTVLSESHTAWGENIAAGSPNADGTMKQWMNSPRHKDNILDSNFKSIGIGCAVVDGTTYWVQLFGDRNITVAASGAYKDQKREARISVNPRAGFYSATLSASKTTLNAGQTATLTYRCKNSAIFNSKIKPKSFTFTSSNTAICTVDATGKVTAKGGGTATITAYPKGVSGAKVSVKIKVNAPKKTTKANKYTITYNKNGGKGKISATNTTYGKNVKLKANKFTRSKHKFNGWTVYRRSDKKWLYVNGKKTNWYKKGKQPKGYKLQVYKNKAKVKNLTTKANDRIVMYARWKKR